MTFTEFKKEFYRLEALINKEHAEGKSFRKGDAGFDAWEVLLKEPNFSIFHHRLFPTQEADWEAEWEAGCYDTIYD